MRKYFEIYFNDERHFHPSQQVLGIIEVFRWVVVKELVATSNEIIN